MSQFAWVPFDLVIICLFSINELLNQVNSSASSGSEAFVDVFVWCRNLSICMEHYELIWLGDYLHLCRNRLLKLIGNWRN